MSHIANTIYMEDVFQRRTDWLSDMGFTERDVMSDRCGEYVIDVVDMEPHETGGIYERKIYLPQELSSNIFKHDSVRTTE